MGVYDTTDVSQIMLFYVHFVKPSRTRKPLGLYFAKRWSSLFQGLKKFSNPVEVNNSNRLAKRAEIVLLQRFALSV